MKFEIHFYLRQHFSTLNTSCNPKMCHNFARFGLASMPNNTAFRFRAFYFLIFIWSTILCYTCCFFDRFGSWASRGRFFWRNTHVHTRLLLSESFIRFFPMLSCSHVFLHAYPSLRTDLRDINVCIFVVDYAGQPKVIGYIIPLIIFFLIHFGK